MTIPVVDFGTSGLRVSLLGLGAGQIGNQRLDDAQAGGLLHAALDLGIRLIDTAPSYGSSEERIGRHLAHRRSEFVLSTKVGYGIEGVPDWTAACVTHCIDHALRRLRTEHIDIALLHSCDLQVLQRGDVIDALDRARQAGKIGVAGYSGEGDALRYALQCGRFGSLECSVNLCDQKVLDDVIPGARAAGIGVIAKRPIANAPWRFVQRPVGNYAEEYWQRWQTMNIDAQGFEWLDLALRFTAWHSGAHSGIVGTSSAEHLRLNAEIIARGPLPDALVGVVREAFGRCGEDWHGQV